MNRFIEIIKYTWKAKGRHGIHSPFVYDLVDICFKIPVSKKNLNKVSAFTKVHSSTLSCLIQLSKHLKHRTIVVESAIHMDIEKLVRDQDGQTKILTYTNFESLGKETQAYILLLNVDTIKDRLITKVNELLPLLDEHSILLIDGIRSNESIFSDWQQLLPNTDLHFSADLYQFGLLAKRSFQEKEHFVLRY